MEHPERAADNADGASEDSLAAVQAHYAEVAAAIAQQVPAATASSCPCCESEANATATQGEAGNLYEAAATEGLPAAALAASRGCGDPVAKANLQPGETVLDLGSGGGIDALIAAQLVGPAGKVLGIDVTEEMVQLARRNASEAEAANVEFLHGRIEQLPLPDSSVDVVISNCVINFSDDKPAVLAEACRVLKPGGRLTVSDIVAFHAYPSELDQPLRTITGCTNGITLHDEYLRLLQRVGFAKASIEPKTTYTLDVLHEKATRKNRLTAWEKVTGRAEADGCCGSAIITAWAPPAQTV